MQYSQSQNHLKWVSKCQMLNRKWLMANAMTSLYDITDVIFQICTGKELPNDTSTISGSMSATSQFCSRLETGAKCYTKMSYNDITPICHL